MEEVATTTTDDDLWKLDTLIKSPHQLYGQFNRNLALLASRLHSKGLAREAWGLIVQKIRYRELYRYTNISFVV